MRFTLSRSWFIALVAVVSFSAAAVGQAASGNLAEMERRFAAARLNAVHLLAPRAFDQASDRLRDAQRRSERGEESAAIRERLDRAAMAIAAAESAADDVRPLFLEALEARSRAQDQAAATRVTAAWDAAEEELMRGGRSAERGNRDDAREPASRAAELYRRAAAAARSDRLLGAAIGARQAALSIGASQLAPATFARGEEALAAGELGLASASDDEIGGHAEGAEHAFRRAAWLAALADSVLSRTVSVERFVNRHQRDLADLAAAAGIPAPDLSAVELRDPDSNAAADLERVILDLLSRNADLDASLRAERATSAQLGDQVRSLEDALTDSERRYTEARAGLLARQAQDDRLRETSALFTPDEGEVFLSGDDLVLRLHGLTFDSGSDEVDESMSPLLTKVERVLLDFSEASIRIEGHTDSQGDAGRNRALSQSRAIAIRDYLLSRLPISSARVSATGHGEDRPIARNDTGDGRARNRRIEIFLTLPE